MLWLCGIAPARFRVSPQKLRKGLTQLRYSGWHPAGAQGCAWGSCSRTIRPDGSSRGQQCRTAQRILHLILIKPTHYDDNGYPIQWLRSAIPSNTLACLNGLAEDCRERKVLGDDVDIDITTYDETNRRVHPDRIIRSLQQARWPVADRAGRRAVEPVPARARSRPAVPRSRRCRSASAASMSRAASAMLPELPDDMKEAQRLGISAVRRRSRGAPARRGAAGRLRRHAQAALQLHVRPAGLEQPADADPARAARARARPAP